MSKKIIITTKIFLVGLNIMEDGAELIEIFKGTKEELKKRLLELQDGYCEDEKPKIDEWTSDSGKTFIEAMSDSDYSYVARIK